MGARGREWGLGGGSGRGEGVGARGREWELGGGSGG